MQIEFVTRIFYEAEIKNNYEYKKTYFNKEFTEQLDVQRYYLFKTSDLCNMKEELEEEQGKNLEEANASECV